MDDGSEDQFGKEIEFRARLEAELRKGHLPGHYEAKRKERKRTGVLSIDQNDETDTQKNEYIPMILIVVQGGPNTLMTVEESLKENVPVLVLAVIKPTLSHSPILVLTFIFQLKGKQRMRRFDCKCLFIQ